MAADGTTESSQETGMSPVGMSASETTKRAASAAATPDLQGTKPPEPAAGGGGGGGGGGGNGTVSTIQKGALDRRGEKVERVFFWRPNYVIYLAAGTVSVQFSDSPKEADEQIKRLAELLPFRNKLLYLGQRVLEEKQKKVARKKTPGDSTASMQETACYFTQIADAIRLGLEEKVELGRTILQDAIEDATALLERNGRVGYLQAGVGTVLIFLLGTIGAAILTQMNGHDTLPRMFAACSSGALGALLSIATGIRDRTVAIDKDTSSNYWEAAARILIGVISGLVLYLILRSGLVTVTGVNAATLEAESAAAWLFTILIGFLGGFVERLVPDLLDKTGSRIKAAAPEQPKPAPVKP